MIRAVERLFSFTAVPRVGKWGIILDWNKHVIFVFYLPNIMLQKFSSFKRKSPFVSE